MTTTMNPTAVKMPPRPNGPTHRQLRALAHGPMSWDALLGKVKLHSDGTIRTLSHAEALARMVRDDLVTADEVDGLTLYGITDAGVLQLADLDSRDEQAALQRTQEAIARAQANPGPPPDVPPIANFDDIRLLTGSSTRRAASAADLAPQPPRQGSQAALGHPSRIGDRLHYRDGRITTMTGELVTTNTNTNTTTQSK